MFGPLRALLAFFAMFATKLPTKGKKK